VASFKKTKINLKNAKDGIGLGEEVEGEEITKEIEAES
jgi:hypothetical protein